MSNDEQVFVRLQRHLDDQAVGFPSTPSGVELRVLKHLFTPREAEVACSLKYKFESLSAIFERSRGCVSTAEDLSSILDGMHKKGTIEALERDGVKSYRNVPLVVGMYEMQSGRMTPEFLADVNEYMSDKRFGLSFLSTALPQMRTIPIGKSIRPHHQIGTFDEVASLLQQSDGPFVIVECICRKKKTLAGKPCRATSRKETCLGLGGMGESFLKSGNGREISRDDAIAIIERNQEDGLVLQASNAAKPEFICSCCGCCCGMLDVHRQLPIPIEFWSSNFFAVVDGGSCNGCGICVKRCQAGAVTVPRISGSTAAVDLTRCLGCGVCVPTCPKGALALVKKKTETRPPETMELLYDIIYARKAGLLAKLKVAGKLLLDVIRTGRFGLLK